MLPKSIAVLILYATLHRPAHCVTFPTARDLCVGRVSGYSYPDLADCTKYTICYADRQETKSCDDLKYRYFSEEAQACVSHTNHCFQCPLVAFNEQRIKGYCNQFIRCIHGKPQYFTCSDGLLFDDDLDTCDVAHLVRNKCDPCPITDRNDYIFRPDPYHCDAYFVCVSGQRIRVECAPTLQFNELTKQCETAENVKCIEPTTTTTKTTTKPTSSTVNATSQRYQSP